MADAARPHAGADALPRSRATAAFERRVGRALGVYASGSAPLVVAASGGPDSTAALVATARVAAGEVVAACFDHRMRAAAETARDRAFVRDVARAVGAAVRVGSARGTPPRSESAARELRYGWLARVCGADGATVAVTGHTLDDQAETVLLRLARGTGLEGAGGMAGVAAWPLPLQGGAERALRVVRPLLDLSRGDVLEYLDALGLAPREDETNALLAFDRNRVRHRALRDLRRINGRATEHIAGFARLARRDDEALTAWARRVLDAEVTFAAGAARVPRRLLGNLPPAVASRVLRLAAAELGLRFEGAQLELLLAGARSGARIALSGGSARVEAEWVEIAPEPRSRALRRPVAGRD